jgi:hypothetical protein
VLRRYRKRRVSDANCLVQELDFEPELPRGELDLELPDRCGTDADLVRRVLDRCKGFGTKSRIAKENPD